MPITVTCAGCGKKFVVAEQYAGKNGKCKNCGAIVTVPQVSDGTSPPQARQAAPAPVPGTPPPARAINFADPQSIRQAPPLSSPIVMRKGKKQTDEPVDPSADPPDLAAIAPKGKSGANVPLPPGDLEPEIGSGLRNRTFFSANPVLSVVGGLVVLVALAYGVIPSFRGGVNSIFTSTAGYVSSLGNNILGKPRLIG
jgi:hypothetical protein